MSPKLNIGADYEAKLSGDVPTTIASLPVSFSFTADTSDVCALNGEAGWTQRALAAVKKGALGLVITNPVPESTNELTTASQAAGTIVVLDQRWASNPAIGKAARSFEECMTGVILLDSVATTSPGTAITDLMTQHLTLIQQLGVPLTTLQLIQHGRHGYVIAGHLPNGSPLALQGITTASRQPRCTVSALTRDGGIEVIVPDPETARPAHVVITSPEGSVLLPTLYESAHRAAWARLKRALSEGEEPGDLANFTKVATLVQDMT